MIHLREDIVLPLLLLIRVHIADRIDHVVGSRKKLPQFSNYVACVLRTKIRSQFQLVSWKLITMVFVEQCTFFLYMYGL